ncbi:MAG: hypothetical protein WCL04_09570 [Verrucomicrobiota bacterium]
MRLLLLATLLALVPAAGLHAAAPAAALKLVRIWPEWRAAESFARISEFFTGKENSGDQTILRTQPAERAGFYYLVRTEAKAAVTNARIELQILLPGVEKPKVFGFPATLPAGSHVTLAGLTGTDWPGEKTLPIAWHLAVLAADGTLLAEEKSFLWVDSMAVKK